MNFSSWASGLPWSNLLWNTTEVICGVSILIVSVWLAVKYVGKIYIAIKNWGKAE